MQDFKQLRAWQQGRKLVLQVHNVFARRRMPSYGWLKTQILKAAGSIPANLAEGCGKDSPKDLARFADNSTGSARELENWFIQCLDLRFISRAEFDELNESLDHTRRMLIRLADTVRKHHRRSAGGDEPTTGDRRPA